MERLILGGGQRLCFLPLHIQHTVFIPSVNMEKGRKSAFPDDAILNRLELAKGLVRKQRPLNSPPREGTFQLLKYLKVALLAADAGKGASMLPGRHS